MTLQEKIQNDMRLALKSGDTFRVGVLRMLNAALGNKEIEKHATCVRAGAPAESLTNEECWAVLQKEYKQRKESAAAYEQGGRHDLQTIELQEADVITEYLPQMLSEQEVRTRVQGVIDSQEQNGSIERGAVMKILSAEFKGKADMGLVARIVGELLGS